MILNVTVAADDDLRSRLTYGIDKQNDVTFTFKSGLNVLAGPNGSGKSTLQRVLRECTQQKGSERFKLKYDKAGGLRSFDTEKMNLRTQSQFREGVSMLFQVQSHFMSHGQALRPIMTEFDFLKPDDTLMIDEPEAASDHVGVRAIRDALVKQAKSNQIIVATHSPMIWTAADHLIEFGSGYVRGVVRDMQQCLAQVYGSAS